MSAANKLKPPMDLNEVHIDVAANGYVVDTGLEAPYHIAVFTSIQDLFSWLADNLVRPASFTH